MNFKERTQTAFHLDITPIVDTVFNLLIFFALSLNFIVTPGIKVNLPESLTEELIREREEIIVVVKRGNEIVVNDTPVSSDELFTALTREATKSPGSLIIIHADQDVVHGIVVMVMDTAKRAGFTKLAIATSVMNKNSSEERDQ